MASTRVVFPWSTCATIAMLRMEVLVIYTWGTSIVARWAGGAEFWRAEAGICWGLRRIFGGCGGVCRTGGGAGRALSSILLGGMGRRVAAVLRGGEAGLGSFGCTRMRSERRGCNCLKAWA